jgi:magnesium-protoporphyrin IX monomethyl ester (oxidative) cyclase
MVDAITPQVEIEARYPHLGLAYLVSCVRQKIPEHKIEFRIVNNDVYRSAKQFRPDLVGISSVSQNFMIAKAYAAHFAKQGIPVILGGVHISVLPQNLPGDAVVACLDEGEETFVEILKVILNDDLRAGTLAGIPGIAFWEDGKLQVTNKRPLIAILDELPLPARDLLDVRQHAHIFSSRGCPYRCSFCVSSRFWDKVRFFSAEYVVTEIDYLVREFDVTTITFYDDLFAANRERLEQIVLLLEKRKLLGKVRFSGSCRANIVDAELAGLLSRMGVVSVGMGLESGDEDVLRYLKGGNISLEHNRRAVRELKKVGIAVGGSFIIGSPNESREQILRTYDFIRECNLDTLIVNLLTPFPGTPIWDYAKNRGLVSDDMLDFSRLDVNVYRQPEKAIIMSEVLTQDEILLLYRIGRRMRFWTNLKRVWRHPMRQDLPKIAFDILREFLSNLLRRRKRVR